MKSFKIFIFLLIPFGVFGQKASIRKIAIGLSFMPDISFRTLKYKGSNELASKIRNLETWKFSYSAGLNIRYNLNKRVAVQTGILYSSQVYQTKFQSLNWSTPNNEYPNQSKTVFNFNYLELPLNLNYNFIENSGLNFYGIIGLSSSIFISKQTKIVSKFNNETTSQSNTKYHGYSRFNLLANIGFAISYKLSKRFKIIAEPKFQHSLNSITVSLDAKEHLYNAGIDFKFFYSFIEKRSK